MNHSWHDVPEDVELDVPWYDTIDVSDEECDLSLDEMAAEVEKCIERSKSLLDEVDFSDGRRKRVKDGDIIDEVNPQGAD